MGSSNTKEGDLINFVNPFEGPKNQTQNKNLSKTFKMLFSKIGNNQNTQNPPNSINKKLSSSFCLDKEESNKSYNKLLEQGTSDLDNLFLAEFSKSTDENSSTNSDYKDITEEFSKKSGKSCVINKLRAEDFQTLPKKTGEMIRKEYYSKLICTKSWTPFQKEKKHKTIFIFDWDDTLFCSSFIFPNGSGLNDKRITQKDMALINHLDEIVFSILNKSLSIFLFLCYNHYHSHFYHWNRLHRLLFYLCSS